LGLDLGKHLNSDPLSTFLFIVTELNCYGKQDGGCPQDWTANNVACTPYPDFIKETIMTKRKPPTLHNWALVTMAVTLVGLSLPLLAGLGLVIGILFGWTGRGLGGK
jgi:hypothetical protein